MVSPYQTDKRQYLSFQPPCGPTGILTHYNNHQTLPTHLKETFLIFILNLEKKKMLEKINKKKLLVFFSDILIQPIINLAPPWGKIFFGPPTPKNKSPS